MAATPPPSPARSVLHGSRVTLIPCYTDPVANLTLSIDDDLLRRARIRALERETSVNAAVREFLEQYAGAPDRNPADEFLDFTETHTVSSGPSGRTWTRESLYDRR